MSNKAALERRYRHGPQRLARIHRQWERRQRNIATHGDSFGHSWRTGYRQILSNGGKP